MMPLAHFLLLYCILMFNSVEFDAVQSNDVVFIVIVLVLWLLFIDSVFKELIHMVENLMFHEFKMKENKKYKTIFDSLQEGILIIERPKKQTAVSLPAISFCNEIAETIF